MKGGPFSAIKSVVANAAGLDVKLKADESRIYEAANDALAVLWGTESGRLALFEEKGCVCAECFWQKCSNCRGSWIGSSLPANVLQVHSWRIDGSVVQMVSRHSSEHDGYDCDCCVSSCGCWNASDFGDLHWLEREPQEKQPVGVLFFTDEPEDVGLLVGADYEDAEGIQRREDIPLALEGGQTSHTVACWHSISFPERCGWIEVRSDSNELLGRYHPSIHEPRHRRFRFNGIPAGARLEWEGTTSPMDVRFDTDRVPTVNPKIWQYAVKMSALELKENRTGDEERAYGTMATRLAQTLEQMVRSELRPSTFNMRPKDGISSIRRQARRGSRAMSRTLFSPC